MHQIHPVDITFPLGFLYKCVNSFHVTGTAVVDQEVFVPPATVLSTQRATRTAVNVAAAAVADNTRETSDNGKTLWSGSVAMPRRDDDATTGGAPRVHVKSTTGQRAVFAER